MHLDITSKSRTVQAVNPQSTSSAVTSAAIEARHFRGALAIIHCGTLGGNLAFELLESDTAAGTFVRVPDSDTVIAAADAGKRHLFAFDLSPRKPYVRLQLTPTGASLVGASFVMTAAGDTRHVLDADDQPVYTILK